MEKKQIKLFNVAFDSLYNLKYQGRLSSVLDSKINLIMDDISKYCESLGYDFRLNDRTQKFRLLKIK